MNSTSPSSAASASAPRGPERIGILGGGNFGSALADIAGTRGCDTVQWFRDPAQARDFADKGENVKYLPGFPLSRNIRATSSLEEAVRGRTVLFLCVPSTSFRQVARQVGDFADGSQILVSTTKGVEAESFRLMSEILREETGCLKLGVLSGPNLAREIVARLPGGTVIASRFEEVRERVQDILSCPYFRVYSNDDVYGVELGGVLKNIYAIASGLVSALDLGDNAKGMMITRALAEMSRFAERLGATPLTFLGLAGVGDLVTTCYSPLSRNFRVGLLLGAGHSLDEAAEKIGEVAEGVNTVRTVYAKSRELQVRMHILEGLHALLFENRKASEVVEWLMAVPPMEDVEFRRPAAG